VTAAPLSGAHLPWRKPLHEAVGNRAASRSLLIPAHLHDASRHREGFIAVFSSSKKG